MPHKEDEYWFEGAVISITCSIGIGCAHLYVLGVVLRFFQVDMQLILHNRVHRVGGRR